MFRTVLAAISLGLIAFLAGCSEDSGEITSAPAAANARTIDAACFEAPRICELIEDLFPGPGLEKAALTQFGNIFRQFGRGEAADAVGKTFDLIEFAFEKDLDDPNGSDPPTTDEGRIELANLLLEFIGLNGIFPEGDVDFGWVRCEQNTKCVGVTESGFAGFSGTFTEPTLVTFFRLPDDPGPFEAFGFDDFPLFFDFSATGLSAATGPSAGLALASLPLAEPGTVAVCVADPPDPMAPPREVLPNIALGRVLEGGEEPEVEILPDAPPGDFALNCTGATSSGPPPVEIRSLSWWGDRAASAFEPVSDFIAAPLLANPGERRGLITAFSPVGAVDTTSLDDGGEGGPTTTTLLLNEQQSNVTIFHGNTATATAIVDPAPGNELVGFVNFVLAEGTVNQQTVQAFLDNGEASITIQCDALDQIGSEADAEIGQGAFFIQAQFAGAGDFEAGESALLIISCQAPIG